MVHRSDLPGRGAAAAPLRSRTASRYSLGTAIVPSVRLVVEGVHEIEQVRLQRFPARLTNGVERLERGSVEPAPGLEPRLGRGVAEDDVAPAGAHAIDVAPTPRSRASVPRRSGESMPAGGGTWRDTVASSRPMNPSGVWATSPMRPPGRVTRAKPAAVRSWSGANIAPKTEVTTWKTSHPRTAAPRHRPRGRHRRRPRRPSGGGPGPAGTADVVHAGDGGAAPGNCQGGVPAAGRDVEDALGRLDRQGFHQEAAGSMTWVAMT